MDDDDKDDIAKWAESLTPEGAPGRLAQMMREALGDQGYEKALAIQDMDMTLHLQRRHLINKILAIVVVYGTALGAIGLVALGALTVRLILNF